MIQLWLDFSLAYPYAFITTITLLGLLVGSFLNVVIYRLPIMMKREWRQECFDYLGLEDQETLEPKTFNLTLPHSHCPNCKSAVKPYQNIPILSYVLLKGQCGHCKNPIALRYPLIEALTGGCSAIVAVHFGFSLELGFALLLTWCLIALSFIDLDTQLLPDSITMPLLWLGLAISTYPVFCETESSIFGAIAGYLSLWCMYKGFKLLTGKEGMGYGDFKLLGVFGAWLGWQYLPMIVLLSSVVGIFFGLSMMLFKHHNRDTPIPFGPYLAAAGWLALIWGDDFNRLYLTATGL
ncbi:MAG: prepilin peptidase [Methylococcales bacterium]|nr:prepilin peptidase [Methylococcales bacterium]